MAKPSVVRAAELVVFTLAWPGLASAGQAAATPPAGPERGPFAEGVVGVEFAGTVAPEAWNLNGSHEWIVDGTFSVWWAYADGKSLVVEFHAAPVFQDRPRMAFVNAITPIARCRILDRGRSTMFVEFGVGVSWSDTTVPPRGTRFNYLSVTSLGMTRRLTRQAHAVASVRWLHLSNASREGRNRNPDIEAVGGYVGVSVGF